MSPTEVRFRRQDVWQGAIAFVFLFLVLYFVLDYLPLVVWFGFGAGIIYAVITIDRAHSPEPLIVINDDGVFDRRLRVGVIRWEDIRRIKSKRYRGIYFISLELHNKKTYQSRRPLWLKVPVAMWRPIGLSPIAISTSALDVDHDTLIAKLHEGCMNAALRTQTEARRSGQ